MNYHIDGLLPRPQMGGAGFCIKLYPEFKNAVARYDLTQDKVNRVIENLGRAWLDSCGFDSIFDPENSGVDRNPNKKPSKSARPMYETHSIRIHWGEWGPEHITIPGNACGLDITNSIGSPRGGKMLAPHNVDTIKQAHLLLVIFTWFAGVIALNEEILQNQTEKEPCKSEI